jgi:cholesterol oxidase
MALVIASGPEDKPKVRANPMLFQPVRCGISEALDMTTAIVIGTGFGGAVTACRLAQAGISVQVLERGHRYDEKGVPYPRENFDDWLWRPSGGLFDVRPFPAMQVVQSAGYGGGSLIYANVHLRVPEDAFKTSWPEGYSREALDPYYDLVAHMLDVQPITGQPLGLPTKTRRMEEAAEALGRREQLIHPPLAIRFEGSDALEPNKFGVPQSACTYCGECVIGCTVRAKNTLDRNYLALAEAAGAAMLTDCEARLIEPLEGRPGYRVHYRAHLEDEDRVLEADLVLVCAGAINSTELLLRSRAADGLPLISSQLGLRYSGNGDLVAFAFDVEKPWEPAVGPTITTALLYDRTECDERDWFLVEEGGYSSHLGPLVRLSKPGPWESVGIAPAQGAAGALDAPPRPTEIAAAYLERAQSSIPWISRALATPAGVASAASQAAFFASGTEPHPRFDLIGGPPDRKTALFLVMGRDRADGQIDLLGGELVIRWDVPRHLGLYGAEERIVKELSTQLGGTYASEPFWRFAHQPLTAHPLGGCVMADRIEEGVTNGEGEVFNYPNLFVLDGAILPVATGVNPSHTIAAVAERNIERVIRRITGETAWEPPERAGVERFADPFTAVKVPAEGTAAPMSSPVGLGFSEEMSGSWQRVGGGPAAITTRVSITIRDVALFVAEPMHTGMVTGALSVDGLTAGEAAVENGVWNLFIPHGGGPEREMRYALSFRGADHQMYTLVGAKVFRPRPGLSLWEESTTLDFQLHRGGDRSGEAIGRGVLTIGLRGVLSLAASIHEFGAEGAVAKARALYDFLHFYFDSLKEVSLGEG